MRAFLLENGAACGSAQKKVEVRAFKLGAGSGVAECGQAEVVLDIGQLGRADAFNPVDLLLAALSACMMTSIERAAPVLQFQLSGIEIRLQGSCLDVPARLESIDYEIIVDSDESDQRLAMLHEKVRRHGAVFNTIAPGTQLSGRLRRADATAPAGV